MPRLPFGVWFGVAIFLLGAWAKDWFGLLVGAGLVAVTVVSVNRRKPEPDGSGTGEDVVGPDPAPDDVRFPGSDL